MTIPPDAPAERLRAIASQLSAMVETGAFDLCFEEHKVAMAELPGVLERMAAELRRPQRVHPRAMRAAAVQMYIDGSSAHQVADHYSVSHVTVLSWLADVNQPRRRKGRPSKKGDKT